MSHRRPSTIVVAGGELVSGHGDARGLGWVGRVTARTRAVEPGVLVYALGASDEDTVGLSQRCMPEARRRFSTETDNRLVLAPGDRDLERGMSTARSRLNLANVLDSALKTEVSAFVVGPAPGLDADHNRRLAELNAGFSEVAQRRAVTYVDVFTPLRDHSGWREDLAIRSDGYPSQAGYGLLAWLVLHRGWFDWLGLQPPHEDETRQ